MKRMFTMAGLALAIFTGHANAQCAHDPTVTPANLIMCPNESDTLWTQVYDAYQWYKDGNLIPGATNQYYVVSYYQDAGSYFSVDATLNSCTEMSPQVLVDGWAFLSPYVIIDGTYTIDPNGDIHSCPGDTVILSIGMPYTQSIQWMNDTVPAGNDDTLLVTSDGSFTVSGAPAQCPNYIQQMGIPVNVFFSLLPIPAVSASGNTLQATPSSGYTYQWYLNGNAITGATSSSYSPSSAGNYSVIITDTYGCSSTSAPFQFTPSSVEESFVGRIHVYPNPVQNDLYIEMEGNATIKLYNAYGQLVMEKDVNGSTVIDMEALPAGTYFVRAGDKTPGHTVTFVTVKE